MGGTIVVTALIAMFVARLLAPSHKWEEQTRQVKDFMSARVAAQWDDPMARDRFMVDLHRELGVASVLRTPEGQVLGVYGRECRHPWARIDVRRSGEHLAVLSLCGGPGDAPPFRVVVVVLIVALTVLWAGAGIMARRFLRPLRKLERQAQQLGDGNLEARSHLTPERHGELGVLGKTMDRMAEQIETQLADQRELLATVSHELRTPLGHLRVLLDLARESPSASSIDEMEAEVLEVDSLVGQLLATSRLEHGTADMRPLDVWEAALRALDRAGVAPDKLEAEDDVPLVMADATLVARALANLLKNAQVHGRGVARLSVEVEPEHVLVAVEDDGPGLSNDEREQVFEPFFRGQHRAGGSLGLGLALVRRIAEAHGGFARIEDRPAGGARVVFGLARERPDSDWPAA